MLEFPEGASSSDKVDTLFAYWGRDYSKSWVESDRAEESRGLRSLSQWKAATDEQGRSLTVFEYYSDHYMLSPLFPSLRERIARDLKDYRQMGITSVLNLVVPYETEGYSWKRAQAMNSYLFARAAWGDGLKEIEDDYYQTFPAGSRRAIQEVMEQIGKLCAAITFYNVPLFPNRVFDAEGCEDKEASARIAGLLKELFAVASSWFGDERTHGEDCLLDRQLRYIQSKTAELYLAWKENDERK